ncbi:MAG TPA: GntR family transcriptional regulator [Pseudonocardiaceae bacterium]|jgi:DNA-binding GntR family transcriptional regulator|nr:GntR family transcriptional regulator [Pseudonocardiaceae bacterium]
MTSVDSPLDRPSIAERVADVLRDRITEGYYRPGSRLSEEAIGGELKISRNTLREAFRLLTHERLLLHEPYRGVSVRVLSVHDVVDLYRVRKVVECGAVSGKWTVDALAKVADAVEEGEAAEDRLDFQGLGTANIRFHQAVVGLAASPRLDDLMRGILAELRLVFHVMADPRQFHEPYLVRNREILDLLAKNDRAKAAAVLVVYLDDAERQLVEAYSAM